MKQHTKQELLKAFSATNKDYLYQRVVKGVKKVNGVDRFYVSGMGSLAIITEDEMKDNSSFIEKENAKSVFDPQTQTHNELVAVFIKNLQSDIIENSFDCFHNGNGTDLSLEIENIRKKLDEFFILYKIDFGDLVTDRYLTSLLNGIKCQGYEIESNYSDGVTSFKIKYD